jgi:xylulokinase
VSPPVAVAGIDSSTQSCKVQIRRAHDGALLGDGWAAHPPTTPPRSEQDPAAWWSALGDALAAARAAAGDPPIAAMAVAGQQHGLVALDHDDQVLRPAKLWNDTDSAPDASWLIDQLDGGRAAWARACGSVPVASFTITKLSWLHRREPEVWERLARVVLPHDWLTYRLSGRFVTDRGDASGTGYWSPATEAYRWDLLSLVDGARDWRAVVPEVLASASPVGPLTDAAATALSWGDRPRPVVAAGTGDNMAAAVGLGLRPGGVAVSIGTSGTVYTVSDTPVVDTTGAVAGFADATGRHLPLVCTLNAAGVTDAVARWLGRSLDELAAAALDAAPGAGGVVLLPYLAGERTPDRPDATGVLSGLRIDTSPEDLARAAYEGVVCGLLDGVDALVAAGVDVDDGPLRLVGGGARSPAYRQVLASLSGRSVITPAGVEQVATGACALAAAALDGGDPLAVADAWSLADGPTTEPDPAVDRGAIRASYGVARGPG